MIVKKQKTEPPELTEEKLRQYVNDRMLFRKEQFVMSPSLDYPNGCLFGETCQDWQTKYIYEPIDLRDTKDFPKYRLLYIGLPKKFGKTELLAGEGLVQLLLSPRSTEENYILAGDKDQAAYLLKKVKDFIARNPNFTDLFTVYKNEIIVPSTGAMIQIMSSDAKSKQGRNPDFFIFDEFWNQPDRDLFDTMFLGQAAKIYSQGIIITNTGFDTKSICYEVRELCRDESNKNFYFFEPTGALLDSLNTPWITPQWLEIERKSVPIKVFRRFRRNEWVTEGENPFMPDEGWSCFKSFLLERENCGKNIHYIGIDLGLKKDAAALTVLHRDKGKLEVDLIKRWLGNSDNPVSILEIEKYITQCLVNFSECTIICDPWQLMGTIQKFRAFNIPVIEFYLTIQNITKLSKNLFYLLKNEKFLIPDEYTKLKDELKGLQVVDKTYGWRIDHSETTSSDISMSLGMAALTAMEKSVNDMDEFELGNLRFLNQNKIYSSGVKREVNDPVKSIDPDTTTGNSIKIINTKRTF